MDDYLALAKEEIKRADHLIYVSLKYTRTLDILKHTIQRLIAAFDYIFEGLLNNLKEEDKISEIPKAPLQKSKVLKKVFEDEEEMQHFIEFYLLLRRLNRSELTVNNEYRRNLRMVAELDEGELEITIDIIHEYYFKTEEFLKYVENKYKISED
jgi:hypothetical protein